MFWASSKTFLNSSSFRFALMAVVLIWFALTLVIFAMFQYNRSSMLRVLEWQMNSDEETVLAALKRQPSESVVETLLSVDIQPNTQIDLNGELLKTGGANNERRSSTLADDLFERDANEQFLLVRTFQYNEQKITLSRRVGWFNEIYQEMIEQMLWGITVTLALAIGISIFLASKSVSRLQRINEACRRIMSGQMEHRVPVLNRKNPDDFDRVSENVNAMLDQIQTLMNQVRQVSDNIAHDLRSPLTRLRTRLDAIQESRDFESLNDAIDDADRLLQMFNGLLKISRLESNQVEVNDRVDVKKILDDVCELYLPLLEEKSISLNASLNSGFVTADANLLFQAISNVLDNAVKFSPNDGQITINGEVERDFYSVYIEDSGPGISAEHQSRVFERFVRLDDSRSLPGFGLGLSQVKAIVELHRGRIELSNHPGLRVSIFLPL